MTWCWKELGHQQPWYWPQVIPEYCGFSPRRTSRLLQKKEMYKFHVIFFNFKFHIQVIISIQLLIIALLWNLVWINHEWSNYHTPPFLIETKFEPQKCVSKFPRSTLVSLNHICLLLWMLWCHHTRVFMTEELIRIMWVLVVLWCMGLVFIQPFTVWS